MSIGDTFDGEGQPRAPGVTPDAIAEAEKQHWMHQYNKECLRAERAEAALENYRQAAKSAATGIMSDVFAKLEATEAALSEARDDIEHWKGRWKEMSFHCNRNAQRAEKAEAALQPWVDYHKSYEDKLEAMRQRAERAEAHLKVLRTYLWDTGQAASLAANQPDQKVEQSPGNRHEDQQDANVEHSKLASLDQAKE
jgi:hypothetical protein